MIRLSKHAAIAMVGALRELREPADRGFRLYRDNGELNLCVDSVLSTDYVIHQNGQVALIIDKQLEKEIDGITIDVESNEDESSLVFRKSIE